MVKVSEKIQIKRIFTKEVRDMNNMNELKRELKKLSPKFVIGEKDGILSLWFGRTDRVLIWKRGEFTNEEILRQAKDFLKRHPVLAMLAKTKK